MPTIIDSILFLKIISLYVTSILASYKEFPTDKLQTDYLSNDAKPANFFGEFAYTATTDESKLRLTMLVDDKIDQNKDGLVQLDELVRWLRKCQDRYEEEDVNRQWVAYNKVLNDISSISWKEYSEREYDHLKSLMKSGDPEQVDKIKKSHEYHSQRDLRRWKAADHNHDGSLTRQEFKHFLYPEHSDKMQDVLVEEKLESLDKDKDAKISMNEYLEDLSPDEAHLDLKLKDDWLKREQAKFTTQLDQNRDNFLDKSELANWIKRIETNDQVITEARHLMQSADSNRDHRLTKEEILMAYHEFVNSHATDFGEALRGYESVRHDEL